MTKFLATDEVIEILEQNKELKKYSEKLTATNLQLQKELADTKNKLQHLENITQNSIISVGSNEEELCKLEINRLFNAAKRGPLEFNEVKAFEIYVKSLMLIRGKTAVEEKKNKKETALNHDQLLQLALQVVDDTNEQ